MTLQLPFPEPTTREQARANAIYAAEAATTAMSTPSSVSFGYAEVAKAWAMVADTFQYETLVVDNLADMQRQIIDKVSDPAQTVVVDTDWMVSPEQQEAIDNDTTAVLTIPHANAVAVVQPSGKHPGRPTAIPVDSLLYDVLRVLAARYVRSSLNKRVVLDAVGDDLTTHDYTLALRIEGGAVIIEPYQS